MTGTPTVDEARTQLAELHQVLVRYGLVAWTAGNVSSRAHSQEREVFVIKPSGVDYAELTADAMIVCDLDGSVIAGELAPSSDTAAHAYVYRHMPEVGGVVHTHSPYASAWAARKQEIPCVLTGTADAFGGPIPLGPFAIIGDDSIGRGIVATLAGHRSQAVVMASHGVFTIGRDAKDAVKAAVLCEDVARSTQFALQLGDVQPIPQDAIDALFLRYQTVYGQRGVAASGTAPAT